MLLRRSTAAVDRVSDWGDFGIQGNVMYRCLLTLIHSLLINEDCMVAQLRVIFSPNFTDDHASSTRLFAYAHPLRIAYNAKGKPDPNSLLYRLTRDVRSNGVRRGLVCPLEDIWRLVEMIPKFGKACNTVWTCDTAIEEARELYLNCFADVASFIEVY